MFQRNQIDYFKVYLRYLYKLYYQNYGKINQMSAYDIETINYIKNVDTK